MQLIGQFRQPCNLIISNIQFLFVEPIICANAAGIGIHHRLHGIFQLLGIEQTAGIIQKMFQFCQMRLNILFLRRLRLVFFQKFQNRLRSDLALLVSTQ